MVQKTKSTKRGAKAKDKMKEPVKTARKGTVFTLDAPQAMKVFIAGSFNRWVLVPLRRNRAGLWRHSIRLNPGEYEYKFIVDGEWRHDPMNTIRRANEFGTENSVVAVAE